jgi:acetyltransferase-like isoleucine patch superfamily enzyme
MLLTQEEISEIGFKSVGKDPKIYRGSFFISPETIELGDYVKIDSTSVLCGPIVTGKYVHFGIGSVVYGGGKLLIDDYSSLAARVILITGSDDYSGNFLSTASVDSSKRKIERNGLIIEKYCLIGTGSIVLNGCSIREGVSIGANSLINKETEPWSIYVGSPARILRKRSKELLKLIY